MRAIDPDARAARKQFEDKVDAVVRRDGTIVAKARFAQSGFAQPPDATFTLRLSYGAVKGYQENGKAIPFATNMGGAYEHAAEHNSQPPYNLPESWMKSKAEPRPEDSAQLCFHARHYRRQFRITHREQEGRGRGNHLRRQHRILPWNFAFSDVQGRAVSVDSRGIQEALRKIYGATALADELMGTKAEGAKAGK